VNPCCHHTPEPRRTVTCMRPSSPSLGVPSPPLTTIVSVHPFADIASSLHLRVDDPTPSTACTAILGLDRALWSRVIRPIYPLPATRSLPISTIAAPRIQPRSHDPRVQTSARLRPSGSARSTLTGFL
jgi:hypothetical protein